MNTQYIGGIPCHNVLDRYDYYVNIWHRNPLPLLFILIPASYIDTSEILWAKALSNLCGRLMIAVIYIHPVFFIKYG